MHRNLEEWLEDLSNLCDGTNFEAVRNGGKNGAEGIAVVPRGEEGPQRICVYPKKTKGAGFVVEMDVYRLAQKNCNLREYDGIKSNRPHFGDMTDEIIMDVCKMFVEYI